MDRTAVYCATLRHFLAPVADLGQNKAILAARQIYELDPFLDVEIETAGVTEANVDRFLDGEGGASRLDLVVEECDDLVVAEGVRGEVTAVARKDTAEYAFYRGKTFVGQPAAPNQPAQQPPAATTPANPQDLGENVRNQNFTNQIRQIERLQQRYEKAAPGGAEVRDFK